MTSRDHAPYEQIAEFILGSDLPRKQQKIAGLRRAALKRVPMALVGDPAEGKDDMILVDGIAIDPSELENGYWL